MSKLLSAKYKTYSLLLTTKTMPDGRYYGVAHIQKSENDKMIDRKLSSPRMFSSEDEAIEDA